MFALQMWLKLAGLKFKKNTPQLFKNEGKNLQGAVSRQEPTAALQGCTELSAGEMAGPCYITGLPGAGVPQVQAGRLHGVWGLVSQACALPLTMEASLPCPIAVPARCRASLCWGKFGYRVFLSDHTGRKPQERSRWLL